jgi:hypothetical protein
MKPKYPYHIVKITPSMGITSSLGRKEGYPSEADALTALTKRVIRLGPNTEIAIVKLESLVTLQMSVAKHDPDFIVPNAPKEWRP